MAPQATEASYIKLRTQILDALTKLEVEHEWVTAEMVVRFLEMVHKQTHSLSSVGRNLRVLLDHRVVVNRRVHGVTWWQTTGVEYCPDPPVKLLIRFPRAVHDDIVKFSKKGGLSKSAFIVNAVTTSIKHLRRRKSPATKSPKASS